MLDREPYADDLATRARHLARTAAGDAVRWLWEGVQVVGAIGPHTPRARRFGSFGERTVISFPFPAHVNEAHIHLGSHTVIAPDVTLTAGWMPGQLDLPPVVLRIGDRCLIGKGSSITAHLGIEIGDDVWTGHGVRITDMSHDYADVDRPISVQFQPEAPVRIGDGSWLGHNVVVLPGVTVGEHVTVGAGSVVADDLPDRSVAVGVPARVVRRWSAERGWHRP